MNYQNIIPSNVRRSDNSVVNTADGIEDDGSRKVRMQGVNVTDYGPIIPSNSTDLPKPCIGICVTGTAGEVAVRKPNNAIVIIPAAMLPVGQIIPLPAIQIRVTGTTATGIWVVY